MAGSSVNQILILALLFVAALCFLAAHFTPILRPDSTPADERLLFGVNVYGWIRGDFGGGRTARSVIQNLHSVSMNLTAVEISGADLHSTTNMAIEEQGFVLFPRKDFAFDLFVINAANTLSTLMDPNNDISQDHYRIGLWHWETSKLPLDQGAYGKYYNEIWVPTQFVADAILSTSSFPAADVKVVVLPYGYESLPPVVSSHSGQKRLHRQLLPHILRRIVWQAREEVLKSTHAEQTLQFWADSESDITLFLVIFDFNSDYNRKNIVATVRAFLKAFPSDSLGSVQGSTAGLIIKSINAHNQIDDFNRLHWLLDGGGQQQGITVDQRVVFFNGLCSDADLQQLKLATDCYVSLHRAEGLGLNLMEAALSGVPVIASAFSGSEQFMGPLYSDLAPELRIPTTIVPVSREFGPYTTDMEWGEPSEAAASNAMRLVYSYSAHYAALAAGPIRDRAVTLLSPLTTGGGMRARLQLLHDCLGLVPPPCLSKSKSRDILYCDGLSASARVCLTQVLGMRAQLWGGGNDLFRQMPPGMSQEHH